MSNLQHALEYHALGWSVIPLKPNPAEDRKLPSVAWKAYQKQRATEEQVREWWRNDPDAGIGLVLGQVSGVVALDLDGEGAEQLAKDNGLAIPPTTCTCTGSGGLHYLFRCIEALATTTTLLKGNDCHIELRAEGSYIVLPPSLHPLGNCYKELIPAEDIIDLPAHIRAMATSAQEQDVTVLDFPIDKLPKRFEKLLTANAELMELWERAAPDGDQSARDYALACRCLEEGLTHEEVATVLWDAPHGKRRRDKRNPDYVQATVARAAKEVDGKATDQGSEKKLPASEHLIRIAREKCQFFTDQTDTAFVQVPVGNHLETWPLESRQFSRWVASEYHKLRGKAPYSQALADARLILWGNCEQGPTYKLHNRVAWHEGALWYDLADKNWRAVKVTAEGWEIVDEPPILFRRYEHQQPQVKPVQGGHVSELLSLLNLPDDERLKLLLQVYLLSCFLPDIPHPILSLSGPQGSAKSSFFRTLRTVVDPSATGTLSFPRDQGELVQALQHNWQAYFDNVTTLPLWLSDSLCRASTGEGISKRRLYTDDEDMIYTYKRVVAINGIVNPANRPDFLDRCIIVNLERIADDQRRTEKELRAALAQKLPTILGGCFDALAHAIAVYPTMNLPALPRMADFAKWGACIAEGIGHTYQQFLDAYQTNIAELNELALEAQPFAQAIIALTDEFDGWQGTAGQLLEDAARIAGEQGISTESEAWPGSPSWASKDLKTAQVNLEQEGIRIERRTERGRRLIILARVQVKQ